MSQFLNSARLPVTPVVTAGDLIPVFSQDAGITMAASMSTIAAYIQTLLNPVNYVTNIYSNPTTGTVLPASTLTSNLWYVIQPLATIAALTVNLPINGTAIDGQTVLITSTQQITAITVLASGSTVIGAPVSIYTSVPATFKYVQVLNSWIKVA